MKNKIFSLLINLFCITPLIYSGEKSDNNYTIVDASTTQITQFIVQKNNLCLMSCCNREAAERAIKLLKEGKNKETAAQAIVDSQNSNSGNCSIQ